MPACGWMARVSACLSICALVLGAGGCKTLNERYIALEVWKYEKCFGHLPPGFVPPGAATAADFATEYLGPKISVAVVDSVDDAIDHINRYGSRHTDSIVTSDKAAADRFASRVDTAVVMVNASTRFNDGGELGLGAEIGISTDKLHARGPCGTKELTTYKFVVLGSGQVRS